MEQYQNPLFTIDNVLFTVAQGELKVLLVKRAIEPFIEQWSLPGGFVDPQLDANVEACARRKLQEKTGVAPSYLEQLKVFSGHKRDPRGFAVTLAFYALMGEQAAQSHIDTVHDAKWLPVHQLMNYQLAFDHQAIIAEAVARLKQKALYSLVPVYCLPEQFTVTELMTVIEAIIERPIQRKSLMRRIEASDMFVAVDEKVSTGKRPAQLYQLKPDADIYLFERNLAD